MVQSSCRSQWPRRLRRGPSAERLLGSWVQISQSHRKRECLPLVSICVLSGRGLCDGLITRPEESYRVWCVWVGSRNLQRRRPRPNLDCCAKGKERKGKERKGKERKGKERKGKLVRTMGLFVQVPLEAWMWVSRVPLSALFWKQRLHLVHSPSMAFYQTSTDELHKHGNRETVCHIALQRHRHFKRCTLGCVSEYGKCPVDWVCLNLMIGSPLCFTLINIST
jgi:hypothetical protein